MKMTGLCALISGLALSACAQSPFLFSGMRPDQINQTLNTIHAQEPNLESRIAAISERFLGIPYKVSPLGEGPGGEFDRNPLYRFDGLDCTTYVEETIALSLSSTLSQALDTLQKIRYKNGQISYQTRNHFPEADWIPNNIAAGFITDITERVAGAETRWAEKTVSKKSWYGAKTATDIHGFSQSTSAELKQKLADFQSLGQSIPDQTYKLPYVPIEILPQVIDRIPSGTIANLVRDPDGGVTMVSHQVLIIDKDGDKYVRHEGINNGAADVPFFDFFGRYADAKRKLLGLNLNQINNAAPAQP